MPRFGRAGPSGPTTATQLDLDDRFWVEQLGDSARRPRRERIAKELCSDLEHDLSLLAEADVIARHVDDIRPAGAGFGERRRDVLEGVANLLRRVGREGVVDGFAGVPGYPDGVTGPSCGRDAAVCCKSLPRSAKRWLSRRMVGRSKSP